MRASSVVYRDRVPHESCCTQRYCISVSACSSPRDAEGPDTLDVRAFLPAGSVAGCYSVIASAVRCPSCGRPVARLVLRPGPALAVVGVPEVPWLTGEDGKSAPCAGPGFAVEPAFPSGSEALVLDAVAALCLRAAGFVCLGHVLAAGSGHGAERWAARCRANSQGQSAPFRRPGNVCTLYV